MSPRAEVVLADALRLTDEDRAAIAEELLVSFDPFPGQVDAVDDAELFAELDRRAGELRSDPSAGLPWDAVKQLR